MGDRGRYKLPRTRWWFENKGGNVRLSVVRVCCVKVIWHLPYSRPLSAIPVPAITNPFTIDHRKLPTAPLPAPTCRSQLVDKRSVAVFCYPFVVTFDPPVDYLMTKFPSLFDPWAKRDAWRRHPVFANRAMFANVFPGFGIAVVAFSAYVLAENIIGKGEHQAVEGKHH